MTTKLLCEELNTFVDHLGFAVGVLGPVLHNAFVSVRNIDFVIEECKFHPKTVRALKVFGKKQGKNLVVFLGPVKDESWNDRVFFSCGRGGTFIRERVFCKKDHFAGVIDVSPRRKEAA